MKNTHKGFLLIELVLAAALFSIFSFGIFLAIMQSSSAGQVALQNEMARQFAKDGLEAAKALRSQDFNLLEDTLGKGIRFMNGKWELHNEYDQWQGYSRAIKIENGQYDGDGNIVTNGGTEDPDLKLVTATVTKGSYSLAFSTYLSKREVIITP